ncbi:hybrid sensor histidine kinase/response regulator [Olivibacter sitiensis]|uniref:hybrid sensor histidine kinase/response regulator n=1 Tax=Olivibacter sitiensis TaxID=376470 RepID=UPI0003FD2433|nr:hybrid sensor histidine kinase/response regulator [Olivibacter sitiensis]
MILIVDDKKENLYSLQKFLEMNNFKVDTASSGEEALKKVLKQSYALIILDVQMPGMDGFEVAQLMSGYSKAVDTPLIFLSAVNISKEFIAKGYLNGGFDYITKPFDPDILLLKIKTLYRLSKQTKAMHDMQEELKKEIIYRKELESKKDEFISIASHELKTPLTSVKGYIQLLERLPDVKGNERMKNFIAKANHQIAKLGDLINDLLDVSNIESGKMKFNFKQFDIGAMVNNTIENIGQIYPDYTIIKRGDIHEHIWGDEMRLEQVLINYLTNAVKYSPNKKEIEVEIKATEDVMVEISVRDFGIGIPANKIPMLFEKFYRVEQEGYSFQGIGMGLYICAQIVKRHDGEFGVDSTLDEGSTFYFRIPMIDKPTTELPK